MIRAFSDLNDILIDPSAIESVHEDSGGSSEEYAEEFDKSDYDEDFEDESPAKSKTIEHYSTITSPNDATNSLSKVWLSPSPPKKFESPSDVNHISSPIESSPRAARMQILVEKSQEIISPEDTHESVRIDDESLPPSPSTSSLSNNEPMNQIPTIEPIPLLAVSEVKKEVHRRPLVPAAKPLYSSKVKAPGYFSRVTKVSESDAILLGFTSKEEKPTCKDADIEQVVRDVVLSEDIKRCLVEAVLPHIPPAPGALPTPTAVPSRKDLSSLHIPNYDRYYEICMEIQELVRRERDRDLLRASEPFLPRAPSPDSSESSVGPESVPDPVPDLFRRPRPFLAGKAPKALPRARPMKVIPPHLLRAPPVSSKPRPAPRSKSSTGRGLGPSPQEPLLRAPIERPPSPGSPADPSFSGPFSVEVLLGLRRHRTDLADRCDAIYSSFLHDLAEVHRRRCRGPGLGVQELAMHRQLSEEVRRAFSAGHMTPIRTRMMLSALHTDG